MNIKYCLAAGLLMYACVGFGSKLHKAVAANDVNLVQALLRSGADVNVRDNHGLTPLFEAAWYGYEKVARLLLDDGANVNARGEFGGQTSLHFAARKGFQEVVRLLLDHGADVNVCDFHRHTPLYFAIEKGHQEVVQLIKNYIAARQETLTLLQALHPRIGVKSPAGQLPHDRRDVRTIFELLKKADR
jgi:ankyrin repeat protein